MRNALAIARKELSHLLHHAAGPTCVFTAMVVDLVVLLRRPPRDFKQVQELARAYGWARLPPELRRCSRT